LGTDPTKKGLPIIKTISCYGYFYPSYCTRVTSVIFITHMDGLQDYILMRFWLYLEIVLSLGCFGILAGGDSLIHVGLSCLMAVT